MLKEALSGHFSSFKPAYIAAQISQETHPTVEKCSCQV